MLLGRIREVKNLGMITNVGLEGRYAETQNDEQAGSGQIPRNKVF